MIGEESLGMNNKTRILFCCTNLLMVSTMWGQTAAATSDNTAANPAVPVNSNSTAASPNANPAATATEPSSNASTMTTTTAPASNASGTAPKQGTAVTSSAADQEKTIWISQIRTASQSGNYTTANKLLVEYKGKYGEDDAYLIEQARLWAFTNQPDKALETVNALLPNNPNNQTLLDIKSYALSHPAVKVAVPATATVSHVNSEEAAVIKKINTASVKGNYALAAQTIKQNEAKYGTTPAFLTEKARYYALTNQPQAALQIVEPLLKKDPNNKDLLQIKQYALSHPAKSAVVVVQKTPMQIADEAAATAAKTNSADDYAKASQAYMAAQDTKNALVMINKAVALQPNNYDYLSRQAEIAYQAGDYPTAYVAYQKLYAYDSNNPKYLLGYARASSATNRLDRSAELYNLYIRRYPSDPHPWLEQAYVQNFRGNFREAIKLLDHYKEHFGESKEYLIERARILASANRPTSSKAIVDNLLPTNKDNYDLNYANTVDLYYLNEPLPMFDSLAIVNQLDAASGQVQGNPGYVSGQTQGLNDFIRTPYRSNAGVNVFHSHDSDTVDITRTTLSGQYFLSPETSLLADGSTEEISADRSSGLNPAEGGDSLNLSTYDVGLTHQVNSNIGVSGVVGGAHVSDDQNAFIYQANVYTRLNDYIKMNLLSKESYYDVSPRAVSLGVKQNLSQATFLIQPCMQCYFNVNTSYSSFSDDNSMEFVSGTLMRTFVATQWLNLNFGATAQWDGFDKQLNDGYYDPKDYQYYAGIIDMYLKQSDNVGYSVYIGIGQQKDETFTRFTSANDYGGKAYFGIYKDWYLVLSGGYSTRIRAVANNPNLGPYHVYGLDAALTKRFG